MVICPVWNSLSCRWPISCLIYSVITFSGQFYNFDDYDGAYPSEEYLAQVMPRLTALEEVRFVALDGGVPSYFFEAVILAPRLRVIHVEGHDHWPKTDGFLPGDHPVTPSYIQEFTWTRSIWQEVSDADFRQEATVFLSIIPRIRSTLRVLHLPVESLCYHSLLSSPWPSLIEISITGQRPPASLAIDMDFTSLLSNIPSLRVFRVHMPQSADSSRICLLRPSTSGPCPALDSLQVLDIAFPSPEDAIFERLPRSLRQLSLTDWPRHYLRVDQNYSYMCQGWTSPVLTSPELLKILRRCHFPDLESLELVYEANSSGNDVLLQIARVFPALRTLKIFRYRSSSSASVDIVSPATYLIQDTVHIF